MLYLALILSFFIGAIPFGVIIGNICGIDVRSVGSGNIGATNVWRALGPKWGAISFSLDVLKGVAGPFIARMLLGEGAHIEIAACGVLAVLGHTFSPFLKFKGGKGIATSLGAMLGMMPIVGVLIAAVWCVFLAITRMVSAASVIACVVLPVLAYVFYPKMPAFIIVATLMGIVAFVKHIPNLKRIAAGIEPKVGKPKTL
jgi:glycerol-3-phosphate acyltransferase PlsY